MKFIFVLCFALAIVATMTATTPKPKKPKKEFNSKEDVLEEKVKCEYNAAFFAGFSQISDTAKHTAKRKEQYEKDIKICQNACFRRLKKFVKDYATKKVLCGILTFEGLLKNIIPHGNDQM